MEYHDSANFLFDDTAPDNNPLEHRRSSNEAVGVEFYNRKPFGIDRITPQAIVALSCQLEANCARERTAKEGSEDDMPTAADRRLGDFVVELGFLPGHNPSKAKEVYTALANSEDVDTRATASVIIQELARVDPNSALPLWQQLMGDPDGGVRYSAYDSLVNNAALDDLGNQVTLAQAAPLFTAYMHAEWRAGRNL